MSAPPLAAQGALAVAGGRARRLLPFPVKTDSESDPRGLSLITLELNVVSDVPKPQPFEVWGTALPPLILRVWDGVCYERVFWVEKGVGS